jgi:hypothetical protein
MHETMANKPSARAAWEDLRIANLGIERVRRAKVHTLRREFNSLSFKDGETIDDFSVRINGVVQQLRTLGDEIDKVTIVTSSFKRFPRATTISPSRSRLSSTWRKSRLKTWSAASRSQRSSRGSPVAVLASRS